MTDKKVDLKQSGYLFHTNSRSVGGDEFKQALLKYVSRAARGSQGCALITVSLNNKQTIEAIAGADALAKLIRSARNTVLQAAKDSSLVCVLNNRKILLVDPELSAPAVAALVEDIQSRLASLMVVGHQLKPIFLIRHALDNQGDLSTLLESADCEIDEHGTLMELERRSWTSNLGSKLTWFARYELQSSPCDASGFEQVTALDKWRKSACRIIHLPVLIGQGSIQAELIKRAKILQVIKHPGIQTLDDFWMEEAQISCVEAEIDARRLRDWLNVHTLNEAAIVELTLQYLSIWTYINSLTPSIVLEDLQENLFILPGELRLYLAHYQHQALLNTARPTQPPQDSEFNQILPFVEGLTKAIADNSQVEVVDLVRRWTQTTANQNRSIHKLKSALHSLCDHLGAPSVMPKEPLRHA